MFKSAKTNLDTFDKVIGKMIKITSDEWDGEYTKGKEYVITKNIHNIPCVVNDRGLLCYDILCYDNDYEFVEEN